MRKKETIEVTFITCDQCGIKEAIIPNYETARTWYTVTLDNGKEAEATDVCSMACLREYADNK
jgi:hypothetical protein